MMKLFCIGVKRGHLTLRKEYTNFTCLNNNVFREILYKLMENLETVLIEVGIRNWYTYRNICFSNNFKNWHENTQN